MLDRWFLASAGSSEAYDAGPRRRRHLAAEIAVLFCFVGIAAIGGAIGHVIGPAKAFFLIETATVAWLVIGWLLLGWRLALVGALALTAALAASAGTYLAVVLFVGGAFLLLFLRTGN